MTEAVSVMLAHLPANWWVWFSLMLFQSVLAGAIAERSGRHGLLWYALALLTIAPLALLCVYGLSIRDQSKERGMNLAKAPAV